MKNKNKIKNQNVDETGMDLAVRDFGNAILTFVPRDQSPRCCIFPKCTIQQHTRGLCAHHYHLAFRLVCRRETSWALLEGLGRCLPSRRNGISEEAKFFIG